MRRTHMKKSVIIILLCLLVVSCGGRMSKKQSLDHTLYQYAKVMRWSDFNTALSFFSPDIEDEKKPKRLDIDRINQFSVSSYVPSPIMPGDSDNSILQNVQIKLYNKHTKREKVVIDQQVWEYDDEIKKWWLLSGLPNLTQQ